MSNSNIVKGDLMEQINENQKERKELIDNKLLGFNDKIESDNGTLIIHFEGTIEISEYGINGMTINQLVDEALKKERMSHLKLTYLII